MTVIFFSFFLFFFFSLSKHFQIHTLILLWIILPVYWSGFEYNYISGMILEDTKEEKLEDVFDIIYRQWMLPQLLSDKESACNAGDAGDVASIPGARRSPGGGHGSPLQYSWLENPMDRGPWWAIVYRAAKSQTGVKRLSMNVHIQEVRLPRQHSGKECLPRQET